MGGRDKLYMQTVSLAPAGLNGSWTHHRAGDKEKIAFVETLFARGGSNIPKMSVSTFRIRTGVAWRFN
jgi:hypothetical protein